jgi:hypothetical protein
MNLRTTVNGMCTRLIDLLKCNIETSLQSAQSSNQKTISSPSLGRETVHITQVKAHLLASETGNTPLSFPTYHSLQFTDLTVPISNEMATATATTCSTAKIVLVAPPEDFEMPR